MIRAFLNITNIFSLTVLLSLAASQSVLAKKKEPIDRPQVKIETTSGNFIIELYPDKAPITVRNFLQYVEEGYYEGTIFHRVVPNFAVQGGGLDYEFKRKPAREPIVNEANNGLENIEGSVSMARTSEPDSATSQFYVNLKHNVVLDYKRKKSAGYAVFGHIIEGMETIKKIEREPRGLYRDRPSAPNYSVIVEKAYIVKKDT
jgi:cyclophilin family peptidyl-prolyl cis-trans isomerase